MIDLHCHSTFSDGDCTPSELVELARSRGLKALALTDHDTLAGLDEFMGAASDSGLELIPGVEIACQGERRAILHVVGLWVDTGDPELEALLHRVRMLRHERNERMLGRLRELDIPLEWEDVEAEAGGEVVGRPHFARALVRGAHCRSPEDAFTRFLGRGKAAYVGRWLPAAAEVLGLLRRLGAVSIWAHPLMSSNLSGPKFRRLAMQLKSFGLDGIEAYYSDYSPHVNRKALDHAAHLGLLVSGGSDFHGANLPGIELGVGRGTLAVPDEILPPLAARAAEKRARARCSAGGGPASGSRAQGIGEGIQIVPADSGQEGAEMVQILQLAVDEGHHEQLGQDG